jgi:hypothetical protein
MQALGPIMRGWAIAMQEHSTEGLVQIRQGLDTYRSTGAEAQRSYLLTLLAEASGLLGQPEGGLAALEEALTLVEKTGKRYYEAELHRQWGDYCSCAKPRATQPGTVGISTKPRRVFSTPSMWLVNSKPNPSNCAPP